MQPVRRKSGKRDFTVQAGQVMRLPALILNLMAEVARSGEDHCCSGLIHRINDLSIAD